MHLAYPPSLQAVRVLPLIFAKLEQHNLNVPLRELPSLRDRGRESARKPMLGMYEFVAKSSDGFWSIKERTAPLPSAQLLA